MTLSTLRFVAGDLRHVDFPFSTSTKHIKFKPAAQNDGERKEHCSQASRSDRQSQDTREYRGLELTNGLRVLLLSDPATDKSAASLDVKVGHLMDPWKLLGIAHFFEPS